MASKIKKLTLTSHLVASAGWLGAVLVFLALTIAGLTTQSIELARAAYMAMELSTWAVILPFAALSLLTGITLSIVTKWGLFKHYWIVVKLFLTVAASVLLVLHLQPISIMAGIASEPTFTLSLLPESRVQLIAEAGAAVLLLLALTTISVYKPWGRIGQADIYKEINGQDSSLAPTRPQGLYLFLGVGFVVLILLLVHLFSGGMHGH